MCYEDLLRALAPVPLLTLDITDVLFVTANELPLTLTSLCLRSDYELAEFSLDGSQPDFVMPPHLRHLVLEGTTLCTNDPDRSLAPLYRLESLGARSLYVGTPDGDKLAIAISRLTSLTSLCLRDYNTVDISQLPSTLASFHCDLDAANNNSYNADNLNLQPCRRQLASLSLTRGGLLGSALTDQLCDLTQLTALALTKSAMHEFDFCRLCTALPLLSRLDITDFAVTASGGAAALIAAADAARSLVPPSCVIIE